MRQAARNSPLRRCTVHSHRQRVRRMMSRIHHPLCTSISGCQPNLVCLQEHARVHTGLWQVVCVRLCHRRRRRRRAVTLFSIYFSRISTPCIYTRVTKGKQKEIIINDLSAVDIVLTRALNSAYQPVFIVSSKIIAHFVWVAFSFSQWKKTHLKLKSNAKKKSNRKSEVLCSGRVCESIARVALKKNFKFARRKNLIRCQQPACTDESFGIDVQSFSSLSLLSIVYPLASRNHLIFKVQTTSSQPTANKKGLSLAWNIFWIKKGNLSSDPDRIGG